MQKLALAVSLATFMALGFTATSASAGGHGRNVFIGNSPYSKYTGYSYHPGWGPRPPRQMNCGWVERPNGQRTWRCY